MTLSFCTTAMARPLILERTYKSFVSNIDGIDYSNTTLYINIEPLPDPSLRDETLSVAKQYFGNVVSRMPNQANFTKAVDWCWKSVEDDFIFHLEDDWELNTKFNINFLLDYFSDTNIMQVALRAYKYKYDKMCLSPSIIRSNFAKKFQFDFNINPEVQLRKDFVRPNNICVPHRKIVIQDIGRAWIKKSEFKKPGHKSSFTSWEKK